MIFNGAEGKEHRTDKARGIKVVYSRPPQNADRVIKDKAAVLKKTKALTVVTTDRELAHHVKGRQVEMIGPGAYPEKMERVMSRRGMDKGWPGRIDVKDWMEFFGIKSKE